MRTPLPLTELAKAQMAAGMVPICASERALLERGREAPALAFALRDAVRKVAPGSYCHPVAASLHDVSAGVMVAWLKNADGYDLGPFVLAQGCFGATETECWALALVALHEAGLLKRGGVA